MKQLDTPISKKNIFPSTVSVESSEEFHNVITPVSILKSSFKTTTNLNKSVKMVDNNMVNLTFDDSLSSEHIRIGDSETTQSFLDNAAGVSFNNRFNFASMSAEINASLPSFVKKRLENKNHQNIINNNNTSPLRLSTNYPSLSVRLNAAMHFNNSNNINNVANENTKSDGISSSKTKKISKVGDSNISSSKRKRTINSESLNKTDKLLDTKMNDTNGNNIVIPTNRINSVDLFSESNIFSSNDIDKILNYLLNADKGIGENILNCENKYVHVTSKYNLEPVVRKNFYDLLIIDLPCDPSESNKSVAIVRGKGMKQELPRNEIMQLSLYGLLCHCTERIGQIDYEYDEFISLKDFMMEREQFLFLRSGTFFGILYQYNIY